MEKYKKKPDEVEAIQFEGLESVTEIVDWIIANDGMAVYVAAVPDTAEQMGRAQSIRIVAPWKTFEAVVGDYVVKGLDKTFSVFKLEEFLAAWELADTQEDTNA